MPLVSIIVPCYNEQETICFLLDAICQQTVDLHDLEVVIADGRSTDHTRERIQAFSESHPDLSVRVVENLKRNIPSGVNCALAASKGEYIIRLDGHSIPSPDYVRLCLRDLQAGLGENVGGVWEIKPRGKGLVQRAIAAAASHRLGVGDARYRYTNQPGYVDTVPFGAFRRKVFEQVGYFDENLLTNEDYEMNVRLRLNGGRIWLNPAIRSTYFARPDLMSLARQYWRYGFWKLRMLKRYPQTIRWRQALPPLFVFGLLALLLLGLAWHAARAWLLGLLAAALILYFLLLMVGSIPSARRERDARLLVVLPLVMATMHISWGTAFWWSLLSLPLK